MDKNDSTKFGNFLSHPLDTEEVVVSGVSGKFPESNNVKELANNLFNGRNLLTDDTRRWEHKHPEIPRISGKIPHIEKFDNGFFGLPFLRSTTCDPLIRQGLEVAIEAICDSGVNISDLEGTNTGVFFASCMFESSNYWMFKNTPNKEAIFSGLSSMLAHELSYILKVNGPSCALDTGSSSSGFALEHAFKAIRQGQCNAALVLGGNLSLQPYYLLQFSRLGVLAKDGVVRSFDAEGNGYVRSDAISCVFLQKSKDAKRIYCSIIHIKTNNDGFKYKGIMFPGTKTQTQLIKEIYEECQVDISQVKYVEAHGTSTKAGDREELGAIENVYAQDPKSHILIGSVKPNVGHSEPASGLSGLIKIIIALESGYIPPSINYKTPNPKSKALLDGRIEVVTKMTKIEGHGPIALNNMGFGGTNVHLLVKPNPKVTFHGGKLKDAIPRIVCVSGRTEEAVTKLLNSVIEYKNEEHLRLLHDLFCKNIKGHNYRGFVMLNNSGEIFRSCRLFNTPRKSFSMVFGEIKDTSSLFREFLQLPIFVTTIQKMQKILMKTIDIENLIIGNGAQEKVEILLANILIDISIIEVFKNLQIKPECVSAAYSEPIVNDILPSYYHGAISLTESVDYCYLSVLKICKKAVENKISKCVGNDIDNRLNFIKNKMIRSGTNNFSKNSSFSPMKNITLYIGEFSKKSKVLIELNVSTNLRELLVAIGSLYEAGHDFIDLLFPPVAFPLSRGTPMISPYIKWDHKRDWVVPKYEINDCDCQKYTISLEDEEWTFLEGDVIDGRILFPASGFLYLAWETLSKQLVLNKDHMRVVFENCKFKRVCLLTKNGTPLKFTVVIQRFSGNFEIAENNTVVSTGRIYIPKEEENIFDVIPTPEFPKDDGNKISNKDIYKELRLKGYQYTGDFKGIQEYDFKNNVSQIAWNKNWIIFIENVMQMRALQNESRILYVPVSIRRLSIDTILHNESVKNIGRDFIPAYNYRNLNLIRSGGVCISGIALIEKNRRKQNTSPVLEKYTFVPNVADLTREQSIRVNMQLILENTQGVIVRAVELINEQSDQNIKALSPLIDEICRDIPLIKPEFTILSENLMNHDHIKIGDTSLSDVTLVIGNNLLQKEKVLKEVVRWLKPNGFILSREYSLADLTNITKLVTVLTIHTTQNETLILLRKSEIKENHCLVKISSEDSEFFWLPVLQASLEKDSQNVIVYSQNEPVSGVIGLTQTVKTELFKPNLQAFLILDKLPRFDLSNHFYMHQINKNMTCNVLKGNVWGTYRHLPIENPTSVSEECLQILSNRDKTDFDVYYSSVSNKESGNIVEFSGINKKGSRVMGLKLSTSPSTQTNYNKCLLWNIPDHWSLEDAVTIPSAYSICLYAFFQKANVKAGQSVLVHIGASRLGQAAIALALSLNCKVYTTVNTLQERSFILTHFHKLEERNISYYEKAPFEKNILKYTKGKGVDVIFSPFPEERLLTSARCLAQGGQLIQLGKLNINNDELNWLLLQKNCSYHVIMEQQIFSENKIDLFEILRNGISSKLVNPLPRKVFNFQEVDEAGKCNSFEKIIIKIKDEYAKEPLVSSTVNNNNRYLCNSDKVYVICGGLGGFGLELANWLVNRGCKKLVLNSRRGISSRYQNYRINVWKSNGCFVLISTKKIGTKAGVNALIDEAQEHGPIAAVFNLALELQDGVFKNQRTESFKTPFIPKAYATQFLDEVTREKCPELTEFVMFSSLAGSRGNVGQSNYGMANNVLEMICEKRKNDGYPSLAIQWAPIGDVGMLATLQEKTRFNIEMCGCAQQPISNCLEVMDIFLTQKKNPIVSSMVIAPKKEDKTGVKGDPVRAVANILGISDLKAYSFQSTLSEIGMDSMSEIEIKQVLETDCDIILSDEELKNLTIFKLQQMKGKESVKT